MPEYTQLIYQIASKYLDRKYRVMYLYPPPDQLISLGKIQELREDKLDRVFVKFVKANLKAYMVNGKEPPMEIAASIKNFADDLVAGRDITVRSGDYFAIQNYIQENKIRG